MYHPSRGGVRGGRDQFNWDDVKVDKHRENYLGHSIKAPVGRWQRGKDLHWYNRDGKSGEDVARAEIERVKAEEDQAMREALGLDPVREKHTTGHRLDKHELADLLKKGKTGEELSETYTEAELIQGLGFAPVPGQKRVSGYEKGGQLAGVHPAAERSVPHPSAAASPAIENGKSSEDEKQSKLERREAKEKRKQEKRAAKLARREEKKQQRAQNSSSRDRQRHYSSDDDEERSQSAKKRRRRHDSDSE